MMDLSFSVKASQILEKKKMLSPSLLVFFSGNICRMFWTRPVDLKPFINTPGGAEDEMIFTDDSRHIEHSPDSRDKTSSTE
ncbi:hypothetical protein ROHU_022469 [Labeo rohita]|uniref:Uncharacterized protein n=1 Tax=Labeo rohita TaxID=84645 RepID=A0A498MX27_LABRO|nr:hypothetical protein ROHU_022469 [Labeo rohita]